MLDKRTAVDIAKKYAETITKSYSPSAVILFGSYVNGTPNEDSDIDVGVVFDGFEGNWLETVTHLWKLRRDISIDIEPHLLDIKNDKSGFVKYVIQTGHTIYQA